MAVLEYESGVIESALAHGSRALVSGVSFSVRAGETLSVIGETGSGKTMVALSIMGLLPENVRMRGGRVALGGRELTPGRELRRRLGVDIVYIPQNGHEFLDPSRRVRRQLYDALRKLGVPRGELASAAEEKMRLSGFQQPRELLDKYPFQLSGGEAQRVTIAISACSRAQLVIADEPTNGLSEGDKTGFVDLVSSLFPRSARLLITHDMEVAALGDEMLVLCGGRMMERGRAGELLSHPRAPYTRALLAALVRNGMEETPVLRRGGAECPFYRRCRHGDACRGDMPRRSEHGREWWCGGEL